MKFLFFFVLFTQSLWAQNVIEVSAKLVPDSGSFIARSDKAKGRVFKENNQFTSERISVSVTSFKTENTLRDKHFAQHIGGGEKLPHPRVDILKLKAANGKGTADLKINGITKPIEITYSDKGKFVEAHFEVNAKDFKLPRAQYLGIGVEDIVKVKANYFYVEK